MWNGPRSVERTPECIECRLLLSLAFMQTGRWGGASKQIENATTTRDLLKTKPPELPLIKGILEAWRGHVDEAVGLYQDVLAAEGGLTQAFYASPTRFGSATTPRPPPG